jgi:pSer/pThr/pTyr-binding forkhead associated (FHA) protein/tetratricopeptide (TPR) repeat protein
MSASPVLTVLKEGETIKSCPVDGDVLLGRSEDCTIWLNDRKVSRHHAVFRRVGESVQVEKKSEFGPLLVNGAECTQAILKDGDIISIGPYLIRLSAASTLSNNAPPPSSQKTAEEVPEDPVLGGELPGIEGAGGQELNLIVEPEGDAGQLLEPSEEGDAPINLENSEPPFESEPFETMDEDGKTKVAPAAKVAVKLIFKPGAANVTDYEMTQDEVSIGRGKDCDIVLNDKKASRKNSLIRRAGLNFVVKDLGSANGTFVNGVKVDEQELSGDDVIKIGGIEFTFKALSTDYEAREKDFLSIPLESDEPELDLGLPVESEGMPILMDSGPSPDVGGLPAEFAGGAASLGQLPGTGGTAEIGNIPGITGIAGASGKKKTLVEKFKALPKRTQVIAAVAGVLFAMWLMEEDEPVKKPAAPAKKATQAAGDKGTLTFEGLSIEQKRFVEAQHTLAFDYYKNKEYDKAIFEIEKIFALIPEYKDSREIQRYAKEGKRKLEAIEEERRKKEEEALLKKKIAQLVEEAKERMDKKNYEQARELFTQILSLDPDNPTVAHWRQEIESYEEQIRLAQQQKQVQSDINKHAWGIYQEALSLKKLGKYHSAIATFQKAIDIGASDEKILFLAKKMMAQCRAIIRKLRDPILEEAKKLEETGEFPKAFALYRKATRIDPYHPAGFAGMSRIRGILHDRAKTIYSEAVLAESFSDFAGAKKLFQDCLAVAPQDDIYRERALRKLGHYYKKEDSPP